MSLIRHTTVTSLFVLPELFEAAIAFPMGPLRRNSMHSMKGMDAKHANSARHRSGGTGCWRGQLANQLAGV